MAGSTTHSGFKEKHASLIKISSSVLLDQKGRVEGTSLSEAMSYNLAYMVDLEAHK